MKLINSIKIEFSLFYTNKWLYLLFFSSLIYFGYKANLNLELNQPGQIVNNTAYLVQYSIFLFIGYGMMLAKQERSDESEEVFKTIYNSWTTKLLSKVIHIIISILLFSLAHIIVLYIMLSLSHAPVPFYYSSLLYIILYWIIPFVISGVIGILLGIVIKSKFVYPVILVAGILLGPLNQIVFISMTKMLPVWLQKLMFIINLGQSDPFRIYHIVYGSPIEEFRWITKLYILVIIFSFLFLVIWIVEKHRYSKLVILLMSVFICIGGFLGWNEMSPHLDELTSKQAIKSDNNYYKNKIINNGENKNANFTIKSYKMDISIDDGLKNDVTINFEVKNNTQTLMFSLYHNFKVKSVLYLNKKLSFNQDSDYLTVHFPGLLNFGRGYEISIEYEGHGPQRFFSNDQAIMMPGFFPWYPVPGTHPTAGYSNQADFYSFNAEQPIIYTMNYKGPTPLFTNLEHKAINSWSGQSASGVTLVSGDMEQVQLSKYKLIKPYALYKMSNDLDRDISSLINAYRDVSDVFVQPKRSIDKIFLLETRLNDNSIRFEDGYVIVPVSITFNHDTALALNEINIQDITNGVVRSYNWEIQDKNMQDLYLSSFSYWYMPKKYKTSKSDSYLLRYYSYTVDSYFPQYKKTFDDLTHFLDINSNNDEKMKSFFRMWLEMMRNEQRFSWDDLKELINHVTGVKH